jgi:hypothetical protein
MKRSKFQMKPSRLATIALTVAMSATLLTFASPSTSDALVGGNDELSEGVTMNLVNLGDGGPSTPGGHLRVGLNEFKDGNPGFVGGLEMYFYVPGCDITFTYACSRVYMAYCSEADVLLDEWDNPFSQIDMDGRLQYLTWKHDYEFYLATRMSGAASAPMAATQALVWAWLSDPQTGSTVFSDVAAPYNEPGNWNGLVASLHSDTPPRVGFHRASGADLENNWYDGTDAEMLDEVNQAVYDLAVEATAKAGPWTLVENGAQTGVVLTGANGAIAGETVHFVDGTTAGINVVTDATGFAAWPTGVTAASIEGPGATWQSPGPADGGQNIVLTVGETLAVKRSTTAPPTTPPPTTTPPATPTAPPTTAPPTTTAPTTTIAATTTTTIVAGDTDLPATSPDASPPAVPVPDTPTFTG